jgi:hypothetical protein
MARAFGTIGGPERANEVREMAPSADGRKIENSGYYRAHARQLLELADDEANPEAVIVLRHVASNFDVVADLIDMTNGERAWPLQEVEA